MQAPLTWRDIFLAGALLLLVWTARLRALLGRLPCRVAGRQQFVTEAPDKRRQTTQNDYERLIERRYMDGPDAPSS